MQKKFKSILIILLTALMVLTLFGCAEKNTGHKHTYNISYSYNDVDHWFSATCEHVNEEYKREPHTFNGDYLCEVCNYQHNHYFSSEYSFDDNQHWFSSTCGHAGFKKDVLPHIYDGEYKCLFCKYQQHQITHRQYLFLHLNRLL